MPTAPLAPSVDTLVMREMAPGELDSAFLLGQARGLYANIDCNVWQANANWAIRNNPFRGDFPVGHILERDGDWLGVMYYIYVPFRLAGWRGVAPMLNGLATRAGAGAIAGLRLHHDLLSMAEFPVVLVPHVNALGAAILARKGAVAVPGSEFSVTGCLSPGRRAAAALGRSLGLSAAVAGKVFGSIIDPVLVLAGQARMTLDRPRLSAAMDFDLATADDEALDDLAERAIQGLDASIIRSAHFLRWRYVDAPVSGRIRTVTVIDGGRLAGLAVLEVSRARDFSVMELIFDPAIVGAAHDLIAAVLASAQSCGGRMLFARLGQPGLADIWRQAGATLTARPVAQYWLGGKPDMPIPDPLIAEYSHGDHKFF